MKRLLTRKEFLKELGPDYPMYFLLFFSQYKLNRLPATAVKTLEELRDLALREGIRWQL